MGPMTAGVAMLARRTGAKVYPVGINGTNKVWPRHQKWPRRHRVVVTFGEPFTYSEIVPDAKDKNGRERFNEELASRLLTLTNEAGLPLNPPQPPP